MGGAACAERFAVYRNNVAVGLIEALRSTFPVVERLVGREFFAAMARAHAMESPPSSAMLLAYGMEFPDFIAGFAPASELPYLPDVARLEWQWVEAYHSADAVPLAIQDLDRVPRDRLPALRLKVHPAARWLSFAHPALSIWRFHQAGDGGGSAEFAAVGEVALLVRPEASVGVMDLSCGALAFLQAIRSGHTLEVAAAASLAAMPDPEFASMLRSLFGAGTFAGFVAP